MSKKPETRSVWIVEAPAFSGPAEEATLTSWHKDEAEAQRAFAAHVERVRAVFPNLVHWVRLIRQESTIMKEGK